MLITFRGLRLVFFLFSSQLKANKGKVICVGPKRRPVTQKQNVWVIMVWRSVVVTLVTKVTVSNAKVSDDHTVMYSYFRQDFLVFLCIPVIIPWFLSKILNLFIVKEFQCPKCHPEAKCVKDVAGWLCDCNPGFLGDGLTCERKCFRLWAVPAIQIRSSCTA